MTTRQKVIGNKAENCAYMFLYNQGMRLIAKNYQCRYGEIDLIMRDSTHIVFIEVRYRAKTTFATSLESITPNKAQRIIKTATWFLQEKKLLNRVNCRFDVVGIDLANNHQQVDWVKNAFTDYLT